MKDKRKYGDDDGRVIAPMNVEGMPWHRAGAKSKPQNDDDSIPLTKKESLSVTLNAILAALTVAAVIGLGLFLFILFCIFVWFR
ncbi:MAG: hypothetical protein WCY62_03440 [Clostridia bacterium]|jgi:hypothetical protein